MKVNIRTSAMFLVALVFNLAGNAAAAGFWDRRVPESEVMPGMEAHWIGQDIRYNGVRAGIRAFQSYEAAADIATWYENSWGRFNTPVSKQRLPGGSLVVATEHRGYFYSIEVAALPEGGARGFLTVSLSPGKARVSRDTEFPMMPSATVLSRVESFDPGQKGETMVIAASATPATTMDWYQRELSDLGWHGGHLKNTNGGRSTHLQYTYGGRRCDIAVMPAASAERDSTFLVVNCQR